MTIQSIIESPLNEQLRERQTGFINFTPKNFQYLGWKFTIIGKTVEDSLFLLLTLGFHLNEMGIAFKSGTEWLTKYASDEQKIKLMTIYNSIDVDPEIVLTFLKDKLKNYKGHEGISLQYSEHIEGAIYKRRDIDENGYYRPATESNLKV